MKKKIILSIFLITSLAGCKDTHIELTDNDVLEYGASDDTHYYIKSKSFRFEPGIIFHDQGVYPGKSAAMEAVLPLANGVMENDITVSWSVTNADGVEKLSASGKSIVKWVPDTTGIYNVELTISTKDETFSVTDKLYVIDPMESDTSPSNKLEQLNKNFIGSWIGKVTTPWTKSYWVQLDINEDGSYSSRALSSTYSQNSNSRYLFPAFYYGSDNDSVLKNLSIDNIATNGEGNGKLRLTFDTSTTILADIDRIRYSSSYGVIFFNLWKDEYGPISLALEKKETGTEYPSYQFITENLIGDWNGVVETPWTIPYEVNFKFNEDGSYSAIAETSTSYKSGEDLYWAPALYYGTDEDSHLKTYMINGLANDGTGEGNLYFYHDSGTTTNGNIKKIDISSDGKFLTFELYHQDRYGPIKYTLRRK